MSQETRYQILLVDDDEADAESVRQRLEHAHVPCDTRRVENHQALRAALDELAPDVVLVDDSHPPLCGRGAFELVRAAWPHTPVTAEALFREVLPAGGAVVRSTLRVHHRDGSWRYLEIVATNHLSDPSVDAVVVNYHDVTARRRAEAAARAYDEQRRQTQKMEAIGRLASRAAHDFNNVLAAIRSCCELALLRIDPEDAGVRPELHEIYRATQRGSQLTRQLIAIARQEPSPRQRVDLNTCIQGMMDRLRRILGARVVVVFTPAASLGGIWVDPRELERTLISLAVNAREVMPENGTFSLDTRDVEVDESLAGAHGVRPGPYVHLAVRDTGRGVDREASSRVFEPFSPDGEASGLSLTAVYRAVEGWGGFARFDSELGKGSTFHVFLPWQP